MRRRRRARARMKRGWIITIRDHDGGVEYTSLGDTYSNKQSAQTFMRRLQRSHPHVRYGVRPITLPAHQIRNWHPSENRRSRRER